MTSRVAADPPPMPATQSNLGHGNAILITRPEPGATETAARIAAMGLTPIVAPMLEIHPIPGNWPPAHKVEAILLASGNAVGPLPSMYHSLPVLTVGAATARRARDAGFRDVTSADGDATALAALVRARFVAEARTGPLLLAAGQGQSMALLMTLRRAGYRVNRRTVYAATRVARLPAAATAALQADSLGTVLFFSAETARQFVRLVREGGLTGRLERLEAITIGSDAAMALERTRWSSIRVAGEPNQDEMLSLLR